MLVKRNYHNNNISIYFSTKTSLSDLVALLNGKSDANVETTGFLSTKQVQIRVVTTFNPTLRTNVGFKNPTSKWRRIVAWAK